MECWQENKQRLISLIKQVSNQYGGDDPQWLDQYSGDVLERYKSELPAAIECFESLLPQPISITMGK